MNRSPLNNEKPPSPADWTAIAKTHSVIGEGPVYDPANKCLYFVDIPQKLVHRHAEGRALKTFAAPDSVTSIVLRQNGGMLASLEKGLAFLDVDTGLFERLPEIISEPVGNRFNDGKCDRLGRFWAGSMSKTDWDAPLGTLYRFGEEITPTAVVERVRCSNGLGWSPDNKTFYFSESFAHTIWAFDFDLESGSVDGRRVFATLDPASGAFPDGLTVDTDGYVWSAQPVYGRLVRYDPDGGIDRIVDAPVSRPTSCAFGGEDMMTLYVTSASESLTDDQLLEEPLAGCLFSIRPGVTGMREVPYRG